MNINDQLNNKLFNILNFFIEKFINKRIILKRDGSYTCYIEDKNYYLEVKISKKL